MREIVTIPKPAFPSTFHHTIAIFALHAICKPCNHCIALQGDISIDIYPPFAMLKCKPPLHFLQCFFAMGDKRTQQANDSIAYGEHAQTQQTKGVKMTPSEKQTRLDQFEIQQKFGIWTDFKLLRKARIASLRSFKFDALEAGGGEVKDNYYKITLSTRIKWFDEHGSECESYEGTPHLFREYVKRDESGKFTCDNWRDCGKIRNYHMEAIAICAKLSAWFAANDKPNVYATLTDFNCRYIKVTDGRDYYSLID